MLSMACTDDAELLLNWIKEFTDELETGKTITPEQEERAKTIGKEIDQFMERHTIKLGGKK